MRKKLKSDHFREIARGINQCAEERKVEEEFRILKNRSMARKSTKLLIAPSKLTEHFKKHFGKGEGEMQPEVSSPDQYPHIYPSTTSIVDESTPTVREIKEICKELKNNKCVGVDGLVGEQLKYNNSSLFYELLTALLVTVWTAVVMPASWFHSKVVCLFKNKISGKIKSRT